MFVDIEALSPSNCYRPGASYKQKKFIIMSSWLQASSPCLSCCEPLCRVPEADFGISGLPCTDMSAAGLRQKRHGPTNSVYMNHAKYNKKMRTPLFIVECTPDPRSEHNIKPPHSGKVPHSFLVICFFGMSKLYFGMCLSCDTPSGAGHGNDGRLALA